jgi:hypothetical protein
MAEYGGTFQRVGAAAIAYLSPLMEKAVAEMVRA